MSRRTARAAGARVVLAHVEVAVAVEFDDPRQPGREVGGELVVVDRLGGGDEEGRVAGLGQPLAEVALVVVDEEVGVEVADLARGLAAHEQGARLGPVDPPGRRPPALHGEQAVQEERPGERGADAGEAPGAGDGLARGVEQLGARRPGLGSPSSAAISAAAAPGRSSESSLSSRQKRPFASASRVESLAALPARRSSSIRRMSRPSARTASAEPSLEALSRTRISGSTPAGWVRSIASRQASRSSRPFVFTTQ